MKCQHIEELLPAYTSGDLSQEERTTVRAHLDGCEACAASLAMYAELEQSLLQRRQERPSSRAAARQVAEHVGFTAAPGFVRALFTWPALASLALIVFGVTLLFRSDLLAGLTGGLQTGFTARMGQWIGSLASGADSVGAGNDMALLSAYVGVVALILFSGSWMFLRYARE